MALPCLYQTLVYGGIKKHDENLLYGSIILFEVLFELVVKRCHVSASPSAGIFFSDDLSFGMKSMLSLKVQAWIFYLFSEL